MGQIAWNQAEFDREWSDADQDATDGHANAAKDALSRMAAQVRSMSDADRLAAQQYMTNHNQDHSLQLTITGNIYDHSPNKPDVHIHGELARVFANQQVRIDSN